MKNMNATIKYYDDSVVVETEKGGYILKRDGTVTVMAQLEPGLIGFTGDGWWDWINERFVDGGGAEEELLDQWDELMAEALNDPDAPAWVAEARAEYIQELEERYGIKYRGK